ncbi:MAG TPA: zinc ABC transporter substrate-binding protein [Acidimicrobiia bacterium]|nr:zinc ABC transporter substrate-binding protein [Acidimicrobiia bacterium]
MAVTRPVALVVALALVLAGCTSWSGRSSAGDGALRVVAAENVWGNIAAQIGGARVRVTSLINDPSEDPHLYQSNARDAAAISRADVVVVNGMGYDDFAFRLLNAGGGHGRTVVKAESFKRGSNPHLWYDFGVVDAVAGAISAALAAHDPGGARFYTDGRDRFTKSLRGILAERGKIREDFDGAPVAYTERVSGYLLDQAGLDIVSPAGFSRAIEDGNEPSVGDTQTMNELFAQHRVRALVYNPQATSSVTDSVRTKAEAAHVPIVEMSESLPKQEHDYQTWMLDQTRALLRALGR